MLENGRVGLAELSLLGALVVLGVRIGGVWAGDTPLIVAAVLVLLGLVFNFYGAYREGRVWKEILPDYETGKAARERKERLTLLAREIVSRTTTGVWEGWERREDEWRKLTTDMDKAAVERVVLDACGDAKTRAEYLAIHRSSTE